MMTDNNDKTDKKNNERFLEGIDACRPGSDDIDAPELAAVAAQLSEDRRLRELYERTQQLDAQIFEAFEDVPVPEGLSARIVSRLQETIGSESTENSREIPDQEIPDQEIPDQGRAISVRVEPDRTSDHRTSAHRAVELAAVELTGQGRRFSRRWLLTAAGTMATAAAILLIVILFPPKQDNPLDFGLGQFLENAIAFFDDDEQHAPGKLVDQEPPPPAYPISKNIESLPGTRWRKLDKFPDRLGLRAVAYDLTTGRPGEEATLYVVADMESIQAEELEESPPREPLVNTAGKAASAWKENGKLYVLVVLPPEKYQNFLKLSSGTLAWLDVQPGG